MQSWDAELHPTLEERDWFEWTPYDLMGRYADIRDALVGLELLRQWEPDPRAARKHLDADMRRACRQLGILAFMINSDAPHAVAERRERGLPMRLAAVCQARLNADDLDGRGWEAWSPRLLVDRWAEVTTCALGLGRLVELEEQAEDMVGWLSIDEGLVMAMLGYHADLLAVAADFDECECRWRELHAEVQRVSGDESRCRPRIHEIAMIEAWIGAWHNGTILPDPANAELSRVRER